MEELFDIVDEQDRVIGQMPRSQVHRERRLHRAVHVFVFNSRGELLIHQRSLTKDEHPGVWNSSASGHVSAGEDYDLSATRELQEELGLTADLQRLHKFAACPETAAEFTVLYLARTDASPTFDPGEIAAGEYVPVEEIQRRIALQPEEFSPAFRHLFAWFVEQAQ